MAGAFGYLMISGAAFATVRSYIMISIMFLAVMLDRPAVALRNVALAALAILLVWPESLFDPGFQMSFAAVVALVAAYEWLRQREEERAAVTMRGLAAPGAAVLRRHHHVDADCQPGRGAVRHLPFPQHPAVRHPRQSRRHSHLQRDRHAGGAGDAGGDAVRAGGGAPAGDGLGHRGDGVVRATGSPACRARSGRVPAIPTYAFVLVVVGGLWCALWGTRWRLLGLVPIVLGLMLAPTGRRPDVLIGRGGSIVAVRTDAGQLSALAGRGSNFELARWLEHDGDGRPPAEVAKAQAFRCDSHGCTARVKGMLLAVANSPAALRDDCAAAAILVIKFARPKGCAPPGPVIDTDDLSARGAHALRIDGGQIRIETVADTRGESPLGAAAAAETITTPPNQAMTTGRAARAAGQTAGWHARAIEVGGSTSSVKTAGSAPPAGPGCRPGRGRRCGSRSWGWRLRARWRRPSCAGA